jgi:hypothetical protein
MPTGAAWDLTDPYKPVARFDKDAIREIPFDWSEWLADIGSAHLSHTIICEAGLECTTSVHATGFVTATIQKAPAATLEINKKYAITCRITAINGERDDQTVYLKIVEK